MQCHTHVHAIHWKGELNKSQDPICVQSTWHVLHAMVQWFRHCTWHRKHTFVVRVCSDIARGMWYVPWYRHCTWYRKHIIVVRVCSDIACGMWYVQWYRHCTWCRKHIFVVRVCSDIARGMWCVSVQTLHVVCGMCHGTDIARGIEST